MVQSSGIEIVWIVC